MTPKERVEAVLGRQGADRVPFTVYQEMIPQCETERRLRNDGLCIVDGSFSVYETETPGVTETECYYLEDGQRKVRKDIKTPAGDISSVSRIVEIDAAVGTTKWEEQKVFKGPEDYEAIECWVRSRVHTPIYEPLVRAQELAGDDVILRAAIAYEPLQEIIVNMMGLETFCYEWMDNPDDVLRLYRALVDDRRKIYPIVAQSPALHANYGGNVVSEVVGSELFQQYLLPDYQECAEVMHSHGKLVGTHLDSNNRAFASQVPASNLDYIEAFTPHPDTDMTLREAMEAWPDMVLWINFPSSVHLQGPEAIEATTLELLEQARPGDRLIVGITEDVPQGCWQESFSAISRVLNTRGRLPL